MKSGYFGIGCIYMKNPLNYGTLFRSAQVLGADFIFLIGKKFKTQVSDTMKSYKHIPLYQYENFEDFYEKLPYGCKLIGVELDDKAVSIKDFKHPKQACYLLGAEDDGIPPKIIDKCHNVIKLPGEMSLNVSTAGSIVLFDRINKKNFVIEEKVE